MEENVIIAMDAEKSLKREKAFLQVGNGRIFISTSLLNWVSVLMLCSIIQKT